MRCVLGSCDGLARRIRPRACDRFAAPLAGLRNLLGHLIVFFPQQSGAFAGGTDGQHSFDTATDLKFNQPLQAIVVDGPVGTHWRNRSGVTALKHDALRRRMADRPWVWFIGLAKVQELGESSKTGRQNPAGRWKIATQHC